MPWIKRRYWRGWGWGGVLRRAGTFFPKPQKGGGKGWGVGRGGVGGGCGGGGGGGGRGGGRGGGEKEGGRGGGGGGGEKEKSPPPATRHAPPTTPKWYVNGQGQTFVVIPGPVEFVMGSPLTEADRVE